jgi:predicted PurR-regulated permease PerM
MPNTNHLFTKSNLIAAAFFLILGGLLFLLFSLLSPFLGAFLWALILAMVFYPFYLRCLKLFKDRSGVAAFVSTLAVLLLFAVPGFLMLANLGEEVGKGYETLSTIRWEEQSQRVMEKVREYGLLDRMQHWGIRPEAIESMLKDTLTSGAQSFSVYILSKLNNMMRDLLPFIAQVVFALLIMFFLFRDGATYARKVVEYLPLTPDRQQEVVERFARTVSSVVRAMFITSIAQGILSGVGFVAAGLPLPLLFAVVTSVTSFIPILGAASVWVPASIWLLMQGHTGAAIGLALWGFFVVSMVDNVLKPVMIGKEFRLPFILLFFTILGGLKLYGFLGVFLGPIILSMGLAFLQIYQEVYLKQQRVIEKKMRRRQTKRMTVSSFLPRKTMKTISDLGDRFHATLDSRK